MVLREEHPDGTVIDTEYGAAQPSGITDPYVRSRMAPLHASVPSEIITEFEPAPARPVSYARTLPFIPDRAVFTTESPTGTSPVGARWPCTDAEVLIAAVVDASVSDGWRVIPSPPRDQLLGTPEVVLQRDAFVRELQIIPLDGQALLQLWDVPVSLFRAPPV